MTQRSVVGWGRLGTCCSPQRSHPTHALVPAYSRRLSRRPVAVIASMLVIASMAILTWKGATAKEFLASEVGGLVSTWIEEANLPEDARPGAELFAQAGCLNCHVYLGDGAQNLGAPELTEEGTKGVEAGGRLAAQAGTVIHQIAGEVEGGAQASVQIAAAATQQTAGMEQIGQAIGAIGQATTQALSSTRQAERAAQDMKEQARRESDLVVQEAHAERRRVTREAAAEKRRLEEEIRKLRGLLHAALAGLGDEPREREEDVEDAPAPKPALEGIADSSIRRVVG